MYARLISILTLILFALAGPVAAQTERQIEITPNSDYFGFDLRTEHDITLDACSAVCLADPDCRAFTYNEKAQWCFLKSDYNVLKHFAGATAGRVIDTSENDLGAAPALTYVPEHMQDDARRYRQDIAKLQTDENTGLSYLIQDAENALNNDNPQGAIELYRTALAIDGENSDLWNRLAQAIFQFEPNADNRRWEMQRNGTSAALSAYSFSRNTQARAQSLATVGLALDKRDLNRPAIQAYEASLALVDDENVQADYLDLRERKGFRVVNHSVDSDVAAPRLCVQFSEELVKAGVDYASFITVDDNAPRGVEAKDKQICISGLEHGQHYRVAIRPGLPATVGETIEKPVALSVYVRDRAPTIRFSTENFVLPAAGRHGIPMVSVNTASADLKLYRVGDRSLAGILNGNFFLRQMDVYEFGNLAENFGEPIWEGSIEIADELNKEVLTSFPVAEALAERKPGVYVLTGAPHGDQTEGWKARATQWFVVSDIGISTYAEEDGLTVFSRSLSSAKPLANVEVQLLARNNEVLGTARTDAGGSVTLAPGLMRGTSGTAPAVLTARTDDGDFVFLDLTRAGFDLSDRGVEGRTAPGAIDVFAWTERGIYRAGETVHAAALARDDAASAIENLPLTFIFMRPDGVEEYRQTSDGRALGGHYVPYELQQTAMRGAWSLRVHTDPKSSPIANIPFLVEDFVPDRIEFDLTAETPEIAPGAPAILSVEGRYLYGAPAAGLTLEGEIELATTREWERFPGYYFGLADEELESTMTNALSISPADENGKTRFEAYIDRTPSTTRLLEAKVTVRMREGGGRAVERNAVVKITPEQALIGIRPDFTGNEVEQNSNAGFRVIAVSPQGKREAASGASWTLTQIERRYQWYRSDNSWNYEPITVERQVASGEIDISADEPTALSLPVEWGRYRLDVEAAEPLNQIASYEFDAGWYVPEASTETPDGLEIALDKDSYQAGDVARLKISPRFAGELLVAVGAERLHTTFETSIPAEGGEIEIPVSQDWGAGAYVTATLFRPGDAQTRMPARAIGVKWLSINPAERKLDVELGAAEKMTPRAPLSIPVTLSGLQAGETAYVAVAAVDVGILNLTRYIAPDPQGWYFGQRRMGLELRDLYGRLIDGSAGAFGRLRTGGDGGGLAIQGNPPTEKLVAFFSGPVEVDDEGKATISFDVPEFNGTARIMAVAWSKSSIGQASSDIIIRDPVVITAGQPRFLAVGDQADIRLDIHNTDGPAGDYALSAEVEGSARYDLGALPENITLAENARETLRFPVTALGSGDGTITISLTHSNGGSITRSMFLPVRQPAMPQTSQQIVTLRPEGGSLRIDRELLADYLLDGASVTVGVSPTAAFDIPSLLMRLDRYPYGCSEQTISRALPLLYLSELSAATGVEDDPNLRQRVQDAISRIMTFQSSSGSFGLWGPGWGDLWLDAYITEFLTRAREAGYEVPAIGFTSALDNLTSQLSYTTDVEESGTQIAYALYVLARNSRASMGDLRYYADTRLDEFTSPMARAQIAAALALYGDNQRAEAAFASAIRRARNSAQENNLYRSDYGSPLRDGAAILALAAETKPAPKIVPELIKFVAEEREKKQWTSTQEEVWMVLAARAISETGNSIQLAVNGTAHQGSFAQRLSGDDLLQSPLTVENLGKEGVSAVITTIAAPANPLPAGGNGFAIERTYYSLDGEEANITEAAQNERFVVVLRIDEENDWPSRIAITDLLPAGFEIDNPRLVGSAELQNFEWLGEATAAHSEFRDDRFIAAFNSEGSGTFLAAYVVRAVTPGVYFHPAAVVEDMYRPQFNARSASGMLEVTSEK